MRHKWPLPPSDPSAHLITKGVSPDHDGVHPARNGFGYAGQDDGFTENRAAQDVANLKRALEGGGAATYTRVRATHRPVWALPHFLQLEFLDAGLVGRNSRTFDADVVREDSVRGVNRHLVVGLAGRRPVIIKKKNV